MNVIRVCILSVLMSSMISGMAQRVVVDNGHSYISYDTLLKCPALVEWTLCAADLGCTVREPSWRFINDLPFVHGGADHDDFKGSGYDRGHMCPAADRSKSREVMLSTFVISNVAPQRPWVNRGEWKKAENVCRKLAMIYDTIRVVSMPIFLHRDTTYIGPHRVAVPHAFLKVAYYPPNDSILGLWFMFNQ